MVELAVVTFKISAFGKDGIVTEIVPEPEPDPDPLSDPPMLVGRMADPEPPATYPF